MCIYFSIGVVRIESLMCMLKRIKHHPWQSKHVFDSLCVALLGCNMYSTLILGPNNGIALSGPWENPYYAYMIHKLPPFPFLILSLRCHETFTGEFSFTFTQCLINLFMWCPFINWFAYFGGVKHEELVSEREREREIVSEKQWNATLA